MSEASTIIVTGWGTTKESFEFFSTIGDDVVIISPDELWKKNSTNYGKALFQILLDYPHCKYLCGWSLGAIISLEMVVNYQTRIEKLVLLSGTPHFTEEANFPYGVSKRVLSLMKEQCREDRQQVLESFFSGFLADELAVKQALTFSNTIETEVLLSGLSYLEESDLLQGIQKVSIPVCLLHGKKDTIIPWQASESLFSSLPGSELTIFEDAGHAVWEQDGNVVTKRIREFLCE